MTHILLGINLPAATVVCSITDNLNTHFAYSKTIARPLEQNASNNYDLRLKTIRRAPLF